jgi:hypothetical protein
LSNYISSERAERRSVSRVDITNEAMKLSVKYGQVDFVASDGWLSRFLGRQNLTLRRRTTECQKTPSNYVSKLVDWIEKRVKYNYSLRHIINCDETPVWLDSISNTTIEKIGAREVAYGPPED